MSLDQQQQTDPPPSQVNSLVAHRFSMPTWANEGVYSSNTERCVLYAPGSIKNPLVFKGEHFKDILFDIGNESNIYIEFIDCIFERSDVLGDLKFVTNVGSKKFGDVSHKDKKIVIMPGSKVNPLFFTERIFAYLNVDITGVCANFIQCDFISCDLIGGPINMQECNLYKDKEYHEKEYAFYVHAKDESFNDVSPVFGRVYAYPIAQQQQQQAKKPRLIRRLSSRVLQLLQQNWP